MIVILLTNRHRYAVADFVKTWGKALIGSIRLLPYEALDQFRDLPRAAYIFADLERLSPTQSALAAQVWDQLVAAGPVASLLNHPLRSLRRYSLLRTLYDCGQNSFNAYRATEPLERLRFPVFLRLDNDHTGNLTPLLHGPEEATRALVRAALLGFDLHNVLVVEYQNVADAEGIFHKYSAFRIGNQLTPHHFYFSRRWMLKDPDLREPPRLEEQNRYLEENPHEPELFKIFQMAQIEYGRIDYSVVEGRIQVWEINTNPHIILRPERYKEKKELLPGRVSVAAMIQKGFEKLDPRLEPAPGIPIAFDMGRVPAPSIMNRP